MTTNTVGLTERRTDDAGHVLCALCGMCSAYLTECEDRANDDMGRVYTDPHGNVLHAECRRQIDGGMW